MNKKNNYLKERKQAFKVSENLFLSIKYALNGIYYCFHNTKNFRIQLYFSIGILLLSIIFNLQFYEYFIIFSTIFSVLILELLNTSLESLVDLYVGNKFNKLAKIAKDCSAGAVLLAAINSIFVAVYIFIPKIKLLIHNL
tara:strand:- start:20395 stop:20814 length:420 start_codon:yes stop_codon:yes gene_type:complete